MDHDTNVVVNGGFGLPRGGRTLDRWEARCARCGGPLDGHHRFVIGPDPGLGWTERSYCRACVDAVPDVGLAD